MRNWLSRIASHRLLKSASVLISFLSLSVAAMAQPERVSGEANLQLPDLSSVFFRGVDGHTLLMIGILFCIFGLGFGLVIYSRLKNLPVRSRPRRIRNRIATSVSSPELKPSFSAWV